MTMRPRPKGIQTLSSKAYAEISRVIRETQPLKPATPPASEKPKVERSPDKR
jgi:hypothetical protein